MTTCKVIIYSLSRSYHIHVFTQDIYYERKYVRELTYFITRTVNTSFLNFLLQLFKNKNFNVCITFKEGTDTFLSLISRSSVDLLIQVFFDHDKNVVFTFKQNKEVSQENAFSRFCSSLSHLNILTPFRLRLVNSIFLLSFLRLILLPEKFLQLDWLRAVVFQLNLKYLHGKITKALRVEV